MDLTNFKTTIMSTEELMQPRYKVIADYPGSIFKKGEILSEDKVFNKVTYYNCGMYPHIFKKLEWWEEREEKDMPEYLKYYEGEDLEFVLKVEVYKSHRDMKVFWHFEYFWENEPDIKRMSLRGWLPATREEYEQYLSLQKLKS